MRIIIPKTAEPVTSAELKFRTTLAEMLGVLLETFDPADDSALLAAARGRVAEALEPLRAFPDLRETAAAVLAELDRLGR